MGKVKDLDTKEGREAMFLNDVAGMDEIEKLLEDTKQEAENLLLETEKLCRILDELTGQGGFGEPKVKKVIDPDPRKLFDPDLMF